MRDYVRDSGNEVCAGGGPAYDEAGFQVDGRRELVFGLWGCGLVSRLDYRGLFNWLGLLALVTGIRIDHREVKEI